MPASQNRQLRQTPVPRSIVHDCQLSLRVRLLTRVVRPIAAVAAEAAAEVAAEAAAETSVSILRLSLRSAMNFST